MGSQGLFQRAKRKIYVGYDHQNEGSAFEEFKGLFSFLYEMDRDNSLEREIGADDAEAYVDRLKAGPMADCDCAVILCAANTAADKFVDWEIKAALDRRMGLVGVVLPSCPEDETRQPLLPDRLRKNFADGYAVLVRWEELARDRVDLTPRLVYAMDRPAQLIDNSLPLRKN